MHRNENENNNSFYLKADNRYIDW